MAKERFFNLPVLILIASSFMLGMSEFIMVGILPDIAVGLKVSEVTVGNLVSLFAFVYAPVTPLGSALSARFPRFATHMTLIGVFLAGNLLCAFAPNYAVLMAGRILIALVSGTLVAIAMTYAPDVATDTFARNSSHGCSPASPSPPWWVCRSALGWPTRSAGVGRSIWSTRLPSCSSSA